MFVLVF